MEVATGLIHLRKQVTVALIPSSGEMYPMVIDKSQPIESIRLRLIRVLLFAHGSTLVGLRRWKAKADNK